jgi:hypothetical protein
MIFDDLLLNILNNVRIYITGTLNQLYTIDRSLLLTDAIFWQVYVFCCVVLRLRDSVGNDVALPRVFCSHCYRYPNNLKKQREDMQ